MFFINCLLISVRKKLTCVLDCTILDSYQKLLLTSVREHHNCDSNMYCTHDNRRSRFAVHEGTLVLDVCVCMINRTGQ